jgi:hypothetical protein
MSNHGVNCHCDKCVGEMWTWCSFCQEERQYKELEVDDVNDEGQAQMLCKQCKEKRAQKYNYAEIFGGIFGGKPWP